jgi:hypothetical protein
VTSAPDGEADGAEGGSRDVDRAALLGAALAAVVALTFGGEGEWDWLAAVIGVALLVVLAAFFRLPSGPARPAWRMELAAMAAVAGLAGTLVAAAPLQAALTRTDAGRTCEASAAVAAGQVVVDDQRRLGAQAGVGELAAEGTAMTAEEALSRTAQDERRAVFGTCIGAATTRWLWAPALVLTVLIFVVADVRDRRARRPGP